MSSNPVEILNRFHYHVPPNPGVGAAHDSVRAMSLNFAAKLLTLLPDGHEREMALTSLQQTMMWANAAIAIQPELVPIWIPLATTVESKMVFIDKASARYVYDAVVDEAWLLSGGKSYLASLHVDWCWTNWKELTPEHEGYEEIIRRRSEILAKR